LTSIGLEYGNGKHIWMNSVSVYHNGCWVMLNNSELKGIVDGNDRVVSGK